MHQLEIMPRPPDARPGDNPWPTWPLIFRTSSAHEEGGERVYAVTTTAFVDDGTGAVAALRGHQVEMSTVDGRPPDGAGPRHGLRAARASSCCWPWVSSEPSDSGVVAELGLELDARGNVACDGNWATSHDRVFVCGDMTRGQSLIVWAIAEGRSCAAGVDRLAHGGDRPARSARTRAARPALKLSDHRFPVREGGAVRSGRGGVGQGHQGRGIGPHVSEARRATPTRW